MSEIASAVERFRLTTVTHVSKTACQFGSSLQQYSVFSQTYVHISLLLMLVVESKAINQSFIQTNEQSTSTLASIFNNNISVVSYVIRQQKTESISKNTDSKVCRELPML